MKLRLVLEVEYEPNGLPEAYLHANLTRMVDNAMGEGQLTEDSPAEVTSWSAHVERIDTPERNDNGAS